MEENKTPQTSQNPEKKPEVKSHKPEKNEGKKGNKLFVAVACVLCVAYCAGFVVMNNRITDLDNKITELANANDYDLNEHEKLFSDQEKEANAAGFRSQDWVKGHTISDKVTRDELFNKITDKGTYYVLFAQSSCPHCIDLENQLMVNHVERKDMYFIDSSNINEDSPIPREKGADLSIERYKISKDDFKLRGVPTMVKVDTKSKTLHVFLGPDAILKELGVSRK